MKTSATQLSLRHLRSKGYTAEVVERFNTFSRSRKDLFNVIDIVAIKLGEILGVQTTTYNAATKHRQKIKAEPLVQEWLQAGGKLELHLWEKVGYRYQVRIETDF